jgi:hypothetical protein
MDKGKDKLFESFQMKALSLRWSMLKSEPRPSLVSQVSVVDVARSQIKVLRSTVKVKAFVTN